MIDETDVDEVYREDYKEYGKNRIIVWSHRFERWKGMSNILR